MTIDFLYKQENTLRDLLILIYVNAIMSQFLQNLMQVRGKVLNVVSEIERFIYEICYTDIFNAVNKLISSNPRILDLAHSSVKYPDTATLEDMLLQFTDNIRIEHDSLFFDAVLSCTIELIENDDYRGERSCEVAPWLSISCEATISDKLDRLIINSVQQYKRGKQIENKSGVAASRNIVPIIYKEDLDTEATAFLKEYYPEAIEEPIPVPIEDIIRDTMNLTVVQGHCLGETLDILGQICFSKSQVKVFDLFKCSSEMIDVERGTIIIDADTLMTYNIGCVNNTLAHEAFHWYRHRLYAAMYALLHNEDVIACRCPRNVAYPQDAEDWSDTDIMEWQATKIAPRILMPVINFTKKSKQLFIKHGYSSSTNKSETLKAIINELAEFYGVSKQSAKIRLIDIGYTEANSVYNYEDYLEAVFFDIEPEEAFLEYTTNPDFHVIIDSGMFRYVEKRYIIDTDEYRVVNPDGTLSLTAYARNNPYECTIQFTSKRVSVNKHEAFFSGVLFHSSNKGLVSVPGYDKGRNGYLEKEAIEKIKRHKAEFDKQFAIHEELSESFAERVCKIMKAKHINKVTFMAKTGLNEMAYSRLVNKKMVNPDMRVAVSICAGLDLDMSTTTELLRVAGHTFGDSRDHQAYSFIITNMRDCDVEEKNVFLESYGVKPLGTIEKS